MKVNPPVRWGNPVEKCVSVLAARITGNESPGGTRHLYQSKLFVCADFICLPNQQAFFYGPDGESRMVSAAFLAVWFVLIVLGLISLLRTLLNIWCDQEQV